MPNDLLYTLAGMAVGALVTWLVARIYYVAASRELAKETEELRRLSVLMLRGLESGGFTKFAHDNDGNFQGICHEASGSLVAGSVSLSAQVTTDH